MSSKAFQYFERLDEQAIVDEVQGIWVRTLVYQFQDRGRTVTGLSIRGVEEAARFMVRHGYSIICDRAEITEDTEKEYRAACKVTYTAPNGRTMVTYGYSCASKTYPSGASNEFAYVQSLSKAQRNALRTVIPERLMSTLVERFLKDRERVVEVRPDTKQQGEAEVEERGRETEMAEEPLRETKSKMAMLRFLKEVPAFVGIDMRTYGPFKVEDVGNVPQPNVESLVKAGYVAEILQEEHAEVEKKPTEEAMWPLRASDGKTYGDLVSFEGGARIRFDPPLDMDKPAVSSMVNSFLVGRVLDAMKAKIEAAGKQFSYDLNEVDGKLDGVMIAGSLEEKQRKDLVNPCAWTAMRAWEKK